VSGTLAQPETQVQPETRALPALGKLDLPATGSRGQRALRERSETQAPQGISDLPATSALRGQVSPDLPATREGLGQGSPERERPDRPVPPDPLATRVLSAIPVLSGLRAPQVRPAT